MSYPTPLANWTQHFSPGIRNPAMPGEPGVLVIPGVGALPPPLDICSPFSACTDPAHASTPSPRVHDNDKGKPLSGAKQHKGGGHS
eukprot:scaffold38579_cov38-Tisochrysis_lutea.AAC.1